eukprot:1145412-Pyramimonas_sp.AAC.1
MAPKTSQGHGSRLSSGLALAQPANAFAARGGLREGATMPRRCACPKRACRAAQSSQPSKKRKVKVGGEASVQLLQGRQRPRRGLRAGPPDEVRGARLAVQGRALTHGPALQ